MLEVFIFKGLGNCDEIKVVFFLRVLYRSGNEIEIIILINYFVILFFMYILEGC